MASFTLEQQAFIHHQAGNALCVAGAGTGKTTTLVGLIKHKLASIPASAMLVLMFNRDIRTDFQQKLQTSGVSDAVPVHTFHSFCLKLLNQTGYLRETGYQLDFQEGDRDKALAKSVLRTLAGHEKAYQRQQMIKDPKSIELLMSFIGLVKAHMVPPKDVFELSDINREYRFIIDAYWQFETLRKEHKILFFDDWLVESVNVLKNSEAIRNYYHQQFQLIVVDEFQDINTAQYQLLKQLLGPKAQLIAVGDIDQCIYKWRGSAPQFMLNFETDFSPACTYPLSRTFRFGHSLALSASHLIANNKQRFHDFLTVSHDKVADTQVEVAGSARQVGEIIESVQAYITSGGDASEVAILVRRWSQTLLFELAFLSKQIAYQMPVPSVLANSREVKLLIDLMSVATGRYDELSHQQKSTLLFNLLCFPHCYVPNKQLRPICDELAVIPARQWDTFVKNHETAGRDSKFDNLTDRLDLIVRLARKGAFKALDVYRQYRKESQLDNWIWKTEATASEIEEAIERLDSIETVLDSMDQNCEKALQYFEYYSQQSASMNKNPQGIQLTTIFRAKGCEYNQVYLPYWDKDAFPYVNKSAVSISADTEEERRLAYVGLTRAKNIAKIYYSTTNSGAKKSTSNKAQQMKNASSFVPEAKVDLASELGPQLYQTGKLPHHKSPIVYEYYKRLGRLADVLDPEPVKHTARQEALQPLSESDSYSYAWALEQPIPKNAEKVIRALVKTKTAKYLDSEIARVLRELKSAQATKEKVLVNRLIVVARARARR
ncbi:ATP-dependent helicase [Photobacterium lipolyticum]|uniref:DNA 3'-5' helicase n=1 Tax=Photobacterium lipolyticum TaxID=266810 RepID=A0A2T3N138_9GAMM|nr:ATP-dependent helicase [Photobacterium lipolyticum]PSW05981.1 ATP-dependent helicase [Photobacterium lipolyticum]